MEKTINELLASGIAPDVNCSFFSGEEWRKEKAATPSEMPLTIFINGQEAVTILCTPTKLTQLVLGFLYSEGIVANMHEVASIRVCQDEPIADVRLNKVKYTLPPRRTLTSGCGSVVSFKTQAQRIDSDLVVTAKEVLSLMKKLYRHQELFQQCGGIHCSALCNRKQILVMAEDIGRHNTLDKIMGECLMRRLPTQDCLLLTTGRISSEMLLKAARMQTPIIVSRSSPTELAISLGKDLNITVIGYARGSRLSVFSGEERLLFASN
ncbi:MAG: formate dehydrogenase accessory sulfurtransferase FdhD [Dehalococcoidales bacterium]